MSEIFNIWESHLVNRLGQNRRHLKTLREELLTEGIDFVKKDRRVLLSAEAVAKIEKALQLTPAGLPQPEGVEITYDEKKQPHAAVLPPQIQSFKFFPKPVVNQHMILVTDGAQIFRVRGVRRKEFFIFGMEVKCVHVQADLYEYYGQPPRSRGRY